MDWNSTAYIIVNYLKTSRCSLDSIMSFESKLEALHLSALFVSILMTISLNFDLMFSIFVWSILSIFIWIQTSRIRKVYLRNFFNLWYEIPFSHFSPKGPIPGHHKRILIQKNLNIKVRNWRKKSFFETFIAQRFAYSS